MKARMRPARVIGPEPQRQDAGGHLCSPQPAATVPRRRPLSVIPRPPMRADPSNSISGTSNSAGPWGAVSDEAEEAKDQKDDHDRDDYPDDSSGASHF
jgi:hypothetical protein